MPYRRIAAITIMLLILPLTGIVLSSASIPAKRFVALAVHIDLPKRELTGLSSLNEMIAETIAIRLRSMLVEQVITGSGVIEKLKEYGVDNLESAEKGSLSSYGRQNNIGYIVLFSLSASDFKYSLKAFDVDKGEFLYDGAKTSQTPVESQSWSLSDISLSPTELFMKKVAPALDGQLSELLKLLRQ